jgi:hypothetical protein
MGLDAKNHRIFSFCGNGKAVILDADNGNIITTLPIGNRVDAGIFNPDTMEGFSSNGDSTLTIIKEKDPNTFEVEQNVQTKMGARTCALDSKTGNIFLVTSLFKAPSTAPTNAPVGENGKPRRQRPQPIPDSFMILVVGK